MLSERAAAQDRRVDFSLTTNATLLTPAIIDFLSENRIGVTVSMDGPPELHDQLRVFANGRGSYDIVAPRVKALIQNHKTRPITARVTLTSGVTDVVRIFRHLKNDLGFHEVGFAPVTTLVRSPLLPSANRAWTACWNSFTRWRMSISKYALRGEMHGFSNVSDTIAEFMQGVNKSHPCGAGARADWRRVLQAISRRAIALSIPTSTRIGKCRHGRRIKAKQADFLNRGHVNGGKYDVDLLGAPPLCHGWLPSRSAFVRYGDTRSSQPCIIAIGSGIGPMPVCGYSARLACGIPEFLEQFAEREGVELRHLKAVSQESAPHRRPSFRRRS